MKALFWTSTFFLFYTYLGYPLLAWVWSRLAPGPQVRKDATKLPFVTLLVSAYNEERVIEAKFENSLDLDYPRELLEIVVVSDGSTDGTDRIVRSFRNRGIRLRRVEGRVGKTACLNSAVPECRGEVIVFSDANSLYEPEALRALAANFSDPSIGFVTGYTRYAPRPGSGEAATVSLYARRELLLKTAESRINSCVGADGAIFALRKKLYVPLDEADINDLVIPLSVVARGYRGVLEPSAFCVEPTAGDARGEFRRQVRITSRSLRALFRHAALFNPMVSGSFSVALFSHKAALFLAPFFLIGCIAATLWLSRDGAGYAAFLLLQTACFLLAIPRNGERRLTIIRRLSGLSSMFLAMNAALLVGWFQFIKGRTYTVWSPAKR